MGELIANQKNFEILGEQSAKPENRSRPLLPPAMKKRKELNKPRFATFDDALHSQSYN